MRPTLEQLHDPSQYIETESFHIDEMMQFVNRELGSNPETNKAKATLKTIIILTILALFGALFGALLVKNEHTGIQALIGFLALLLVVLPIHELIHGLTFKSFGAKDVGYGFSPKALMIYAYAQNFPISMPELRKVAMMPFVVITPIMILLIILIPKYSFGLALILFMHTFACMGDYALVKYANRNMNKGVYSYDDIRDKKMSYFFEKKL